MGEVGGCDLRGLFRREDVGVMWVSNADVRLRCPVWLGDVWWAKERYDFAMRI